MFLFGKVVVPPPPEFVITDGLNRLAARVPIMNNWGNDYGNRTLLHHTGKFQSSNNQIIYLSEESHKWAKDTVGDEAIDIRVFSSTPGRIFTGAHTDRTRNYTMMYLLQGGGPDHKTVYYRDIDNPQIKYEGQHNADDFTRLQQLCQWQIPVNTWVVLNSLVLHSVENISQGRISIQINLSSIPPSLVLRDCIHISDYE